MSDRRAKHAASYQSRVVGNGHCVAFVRDCAGLPHTSLWRAGRPVRGGGYAEGTAIATFEKTSHGLHYANSNTASHCAILIGDTAAGLAVWDQWVGQPVHTRLIRFHGGIRGVDDGDNYYAIEIDPPGTGAAVI